MAAPSYREIAHHYCVEDLASASIPSSRLQQILECIRLGKPVTPLSAKFLQQQHLDALHRLAAGSLSYDQFLELARAEQTVRIEAATTARVAKEADDLARQAAELARMENVYAQVEAARQIRESDPKYIAKIKNRELRNRYGLNHFVEEQCFSRLMAILRTADAGRRLSEDDFVWLSSVGEDYFSNELRVAYHRLEAEFFVSEFKKTMDPWSAVTASGHFRKGDSSREAHALLVNINVEQQKSAKLKAALCTTHGGAMRDMRQWDDALRLGERAHAFRPMDFRPCTLLGAIHMETGSFDLGQEWYAKAVERGATSESVDQDLRKIFFRAEPTRQAEMRAFLLNDDPVRYAWVKVGHNVHHRQSAS